MADGAFDGHGSWAEKHPSHGTWTDLEASRLAGERAAAWLKTLGDDAGALVPVIRKDLWEGREPAFFQRLRGLSTTHFGMSTPVLNEERQAAAQQMAAGARASAEAAERLSADVEVTYPYTTKRDLLHTTQQKLRRYIDLRWIEVGPFPMTPRLDGTREDPLVV